MPDDHDRRIHARPRDPGHDRPQAGLRHLADRRPECQEAVEDALAIGYRHIDTARAYGNEREVGQGIAAAGVPRNEFFLTTKIWREEYAPDDLRARPRTRCENLQVDGLDLLLMHWPNPDFPLDETLGALIGLRDDGLIKHLGVSNFPAPLLREALGVAPIFTDQVEFHPFLGQDALVDLAAEKDFMVTAYSPLARGKVPEDATLREIGEAHGKTAGQVALRWLLDKPQVATIPKASSHERRVENFEVFDFELSDEERARSTRCPRASASSTRAWRPTGTPRRASAGAPRRARVRPGETQPGEATRRVDRPAVDGPGRCRVPVESTAAGDRGEPRRHAGGREPQRARLGARARGPVAPRRTSLTDDRGLGGLVVRRAGALQETSVASNTTATKRPASRTSR